MPALLAEEVGLEVDEEDRPVADVEPLAQLQNDGCIYSMRPVNPKKERKVNLLLLC